MFKFIGSLFIYLVVVVAQLLDDRFGMGCPVGKCFDQYIPPTSAEHYLKIIRNIIHY